MGKIRILFICFFLLIVQFSYGQGKYAVHYKFKPQGNFTLDAPAAYLSEKALERRVKNGVLLDSLDLPVSSKYEDIILENSKELLYNTKWMNASLIIADADQVAFISNLNFVDRVEFVAPISNAAGRISKNPKNSNIQSLKFSNGLKKVDTDLYEFQNSLLGIQDMHNEGFRGEGVTIAVFDGGFIGVDRVDGFRHLFEKNQIIATRDFVDLKNDDVYTKNQHGTNVLSLIGADLPQFLVSGAPESDYVLCITEDVLSEYRIEEYNWLRAAEYADSLGVDIINSSLGYLDFDDPSMDYYADDLDGTTAVISQAAFIASQKGVLVVTSAGNYGVRGERSITAPADASGILSIGSIDMNYNRSSFSSQGPNAKGEIKPELSTLGRGVYLIRSNGVVNRGNGTSFSAPQITALAAGLMQAKPEWSKDRIISALLKSGTQSESPDNEFGHGIPNFVRAYYGEILSIEDKTESQHWKIYPNPNEGNELFIVFGQTNEAKLRLYDISGSVVLDRIVFRNSNQNPFTINLPALSTGVYLLELQSGTDLKRTKLIKK